MITLGLIGGVASGKSAVACDFQKLGAVVLNGDRIGHEVLGMPAVVEALVNRWGTDILADDKTLNRAKIAELVFADDAGNGLAFLESVTHPEIEAILQSRLGQDTAARPVADRRPGRSGDAQGRLGRAV